MRMGGVSFEAWVADDPFALAGRAQPREAVAAIGAGGNIGRP